MTAITPSVVATPGPTVQLALTGLPSGTTRLIVTRSWSGTVAPVRQQVAVGGSSATVRDFAAPIGRPATYAVQAVGSSGTILESAVSAPVTVPLLADESSGWVMDELEPRRALLLPWMDGTDEAVKYDAAAAVSYAASASVGTLLSGPRRITARPMVIRTETHALADAFEALVQRGGPLLLRCNPTATRHRHGLIRVAAGSITAAPRHIYDLYTDWEWSGPEVAEDAWPGVVPLRTWEERRVSHVPGLTWAQRRGASQPRSWLARYQAAEGL